MQRYTTNGLKAKVKDNSLKLMGKSVGLYIHHMGSGTDYSRKIQKGQIIGKILMN